MDVLDEQLLHFWKNLNNYNVRYIMVGGFAINFNGYSRVTEDIDVWIEDNLSNRQNLRTAFREAGYGDNPLLETIQFLPGWTAFHIADGIEVDIMTGMKGLEHLTFDECLEQASVANIDGIAVPFLHINQLIANKKAVNRSKDQVDVIELEKIKRIREEDEQGRAR